MIYVSNLSVQEEIAEVRHRCTVLILIMPFTPLFIHLYHELCIVISIISTSIKMRWCLSIRQLLNHAITTGQIELKVCTKPADIRISNKGLLSFQSFSPFQVGGRLYDVITKSLRSCTILVIVERYFLPWNPNKFRFYSNYIFFMF